MAKKPGGLGRGLGSLFGEMDVDLSVLDPAEISIEPQTESKKPAKKSPKVKTKTEDAAKEAAEAVVFVSLDDIRPNSAQPRKVFDQEALQDLAASIREHGVIQPVLLRPAKTGFELVAGERRWRAARLAGLKQIPAIVRELTDRQNMFYALIENMQREDLNSIEEARGMEEMMSAFGLNQEETAKTIGKSRSYVTNALRLLRLPQDVQDMVMDGRRSAAAGSRGEVRRKRLVRAPGRKLYRRTEEACKAQKIKAFRQEQRQGPRCSGTAGDRGAGHESAHPRHGEEGQTGTGVLQPRRTGAPDRDPFAGVRTKSTYGDRYNVPFLGRSSDRS